MLKVLLLAVFLSFLQVGCNKEHGRVLATKTEIYDPYSWDFGRLKEGTMIKHQFVLKNAASKILNIEAVNTSCGCTASEVKKKTLAPQEATIVEVQFNSKGYSGPVEQFAYVHTDNLDNPLIRFIIKAEVTKK